MVTGQVAGNTTDLFFFPQYAQKILARGYISDISDIFQIFHIHFLLGQEHRVPPTAVFPALQLPDLVELEQVPSAQVLYTDVELLHVLVCTFVSDLCLPTCHY